MPTECYSLHSHSINLCNLFLKRSLSLLLCLLFKLKVLLCNSSSNVGNGINLKQRKTVEDGEIFSSIQIFMKLWSDVNALRGINLPAISFSGSVHLKCYFHLVLPLSLRAAYSLWVLIRDGGVAVLAEAGENGQHAASLLSPQRLGLMEGGQLTAAGRKRREEMREGINTE